MEESSKTCSFNDTVNLLPKSERNPQGDSLLLFQRAYAKVGRRIGQVRRLWKENGGQHVLNRVRSAIADQLAPITPPMPVRPGDVLASDLTAPQVWSHLPIHGEEPLVVNWVTTPPVWGSGGHTTTFRMIKHLQESGNHCRVYFYDVYGGDAGYHRSRMLELFPWFAGEANDVTSGMADAHAVVATSWQTAYPANNDLGRGKRFYFVQDYEPWFYSPGGHGCLAENTYRMGFHAITAGRFLAAKLKAEYGMAADAFDFGCDTEKYHLLNGEGKRDGIVFYARPETPRRAFELGLMVLQLFAERHPHLKIHFFGSPIGKLPFLSFPFIDHGLLGPSELNRIYNRCFAGLSLSMTNVSLVPHEMLSAGCIPVVNEAEHNRIVLDNRFVRYAPPNPHALANVLNEVVTTKDFAAVAASASASVSSVSWEAAGRVFEQCMRLALQS
jgi:O-antigen biosynthesis protein